MSDDKARWRGRNADKDKLRTEVWGTLESAAVNIGSVWSRIPNFAGADLASWNLARTPAWTKAFFETHPTILDRLAMVEAWEERRGR